MILGGRIQQPMAMTSKPVSKRVAALRERAAALGMKRLEIYAHPEDWVAIKALAAKLQKRREKASKVAANALAQGPGGSSPGPDGATGCATRGED